MVARLVSVGVALAVGLTATVAGPANAALPACPAVFAHGGYPTGQNAWQRDQVRQPNNPTALRDYRAMGATGVEADLQLTRNGTKAVMWHNTSTLHLTGSKANITALWWNTGADRLNGRRIEVGPYRGEVVHTFRAFLDTVRGLGMVPLVEVKAEARQSLLNADPTIRNRAWAEVVDPVRERVARQEIMVYTHDSALRRELVDRFTDVGLADVVAGGPRRPVWPDTVTWEEPPPSWTGNVTSWQAALDRAPRRIATSWPRQLWVWLDGRCTR